MLLNKSRQMHVTVHGQITPARLFKATRCEVSLACVVVTLCPDGLGAVVASDRAHGRESIDRHATLRIGAVGGLQA